MESVMAIIRIVLPVAIAGGIAVFVIKKMEHKSKRGTLGKKDTKSAQSLLDSLMPLGILLGCAIGMVFSTFFSASLPTAITLGAGIGLLLGYFAYEIYSREERNNT